MQYKIQKQKNSKIEIEVTIDNKDFIKYWDKAFKNVQSVIEMDGFRKGHAPENMIVAKYGESVIMEEMANLAINETYPEIIIKEKTKVISSPHIHIIQLAKDNDLIYHAHTDIYPEIDNFEYTNIVEEVLKDKKEIPETTEEEIKQVMDSLSDEIKENAQKELQNNSEQKSISLEDRIRENMKLEKEYEEKSRLRNLFIQKIGVYIKEKHKDELPDSWDDKLFTQFAVLLISEKEKIEVNDTEVEMELIKMLAGTNPTSIPNYNEENMKSYVKQIIINEKTLEKIGL